MPKQGHRLLTGGGVPKFHRTVITRRSEARIVWAKAHASNLCRVSLQRVQVAVTQSLPIESLEATQRVGWCSRPMPFQELKHPANTPLLPGRLCEVHVCGVEEPV